ncbi:MAG: response regulator transcription factor [Flavonifractor plautii]
MEAHILVAEDEERLRTIIRDYFTAHGLTCALAKDGEEALERLRERDYDAVLLDVLMPNLDGFAVCRAVREGSGVPILFLTALGGEKDVLRGYALGADDYVTKPFSLAVLLAKTEALIRRSRGGGAETLACGAITLEPGRRACTVGGRLVALPPREYELLLCLMRNKGQVLRREQLLDKVWGIDFERPGGGRPDQVPSRRLGPAGKQIRTVFKVGYKLEGAAWGGLAGCSKGRFQCFQPSGLV